MIATSMHSAARAIGFTGLAVATAALCWLSAVDRMTAESGRAGASYLGGDAAALLAFQHLAEGDAIVALERARKAVRTAPVDPPSTSALGSSLLALNRPDHAYAAFTVAGGLGWRDIPTQLYWLSQALAGGDVDIVSQRLDALLRLNLDNAAVNDALNYLGRTRIGQAAIARLLAENPPWERRYLISVGHLKGPNLDGQMAAIELALNRGVAIDCGVIGNAASDLIRGGESTSARTLWRSACDRSGDLYISDGSFETDPSLVSDNPFSWQFQARSGLEVSVDTAPQPLESKALKITLSNTVRTVAAAELMTLQPGSYRLTWRTALDNGKPDRTISMQIRCEGRDKDVLTTDPVLSDQDNGASEKFSVPDKGCQIQSAAIQKAASPSGQAQSGWIDDIKIMPVGRSTAKQEDR